MIEHKPDALKRRNVWKKIASVVSWIVVLFALSAMVFIGVVSNTYGKNTRSLFGHRIFIAQTSSMAATDFEAGDLVVSKNVSDVSSLSEGDVITFISQDKLHFGKVVTHKIRKINVDEFGRRQFVTYGTTTNTDDEVPVTEKFVIGEYEFRIPKLGSILAFIKTAPGYISCVLFPLLIVMVLNGVDCWKLYKGYKREEDIEKEASE